MAEAHASVRQSKKGISRFVSVKAAPAPIPAVPPRPQGDLTRASIEEIAEAVRTTWLTKSADNRWNRSRGARDLLHHLSQFPGETWQDRWEASGFNKSGSPVSVLRSAPRERSQIGTGAACLFCLRIIQPSLEAFRSNIFLYYGRRFLAAQSDPLLEKFWAEVQATPVNPIHHGSALFDVAVALTTQGIRLADLTPAAFLHYAWECRRQGLVLGARGAGSRFPGHLAWQVLHAMDHFPSHGPATLKAALLNGRLTVEELVDRYKIRHAGARQLLIAYLERRKPELDYSTLDNLSRHLVSNFWATIEHLAPDQPDLRIDSELYQRWRDQVAVRVDGKGRRDFDPILRAVRAFYSDLQAWAAAEPEQWAIWVAPCPVSDADVRGYGIRKRRVKERMDDRTRQRQPLLSTLVEHMENRYGHLRELLEQATTATGGETVTVEGRTYERLWSRVDERRVRLGGQANVRVRDLDNGKYINLTHTEDAAFWEWAIVEVLRHSGVRIEEALELTHLSIRQYQRPNGEVIALLVVAPSKSDRERVIPMSAELFAVVAAMVRRHTTEGKTIPLLPRYDPKERQSSPPMPFLFQRKIGTKHEVISDTTIVNMLKRRCEELAEQNPGFLAASFTPHDFRRLLATELVNSGLPIHIGAALLGHLNLQTTRGYVAVFNEDVIRHYQGFLDRRRQARPSDEYRPITEPEWLGFEEHFDQRKVELGGCARPYGTPCQHEHACLRCPMININPKMLPRLDEIEDDLQARRSRAQHEGWLGEVEGIDLTLTFLRQKRDQTRRLARIAPVNLGIPTIQRPP
ncbi:tyrosine-type recombinase/integrase [Nonomuraea sp. NPDC052265]|uniref:tyrosine-type recombinase/integrase n=1 Tax=Nonomuraea sp. NPDC052265 TaxID=3364374 RepID=UPI0037C6F66F